MNMVEDIPNDLFGIDLFGLPCWSVTKTGQLVKLIKSLPYRVIVGQ